MQFNIIISFWLFEVKKRVMYSKIKHILEFIRCLESFKFVQRIAWMPSKRHWISRTKQLWKYLLGIKNYSNEWKDNEINQEMGSY